MWDTPALRCTGPWYKTGQDSTVTWSDPPLPGGKLRLKGKVSHRGRRGERAHFSLLCIIFEESVKIPHF